MTNSQATTAFLVAHPNKHHAFELAKGIALAGHSFRLATPLYNKGLAAFLGRLSSTIERKLRGYEAPGLEACNVYSPTVWQLKKLLSIARKSDQIESLFDEYIAMQIFRSRLRASCLVSLQDYMPKTVEAAKSRGWTIWSDQILNNSEETQNLIRASVNDSCDELIFKKESLNNAILRFADIVTVPSSFVHRGIGDRVSDRCRVALVPYGVDITRFTPAPKERFLDLHGPIRVVVRANSIRKGAHVFLNSLPIIEEQLDTVKNPRIEFMVLGEFDQTSKRMLDSLPPLRGIAVSNRNYNFDEVADLYRGSDLYLMPSLSEGMSLAAVEAMACGLPQLLTPYCGIDDIEPYKMGLEFLPDPHSLALALIKAIDLRSEWRSWSENCRARVKSSYSWPMYHRGIASVSNIAARRDKLKATL